MHIRKLLVTNSIAALVETNKRMRERRNLFFCFSPGESDCKAV